MHNLSFLVEILEDGGAESLWMNESQLFVSFINKCPCSPIILTFIHVSSDVKSIISLSRAVLFEAENWLYVYVCRLLVRQKQ